MGKPISLFSGYSQKENRTTNYCMLVLKMLYEANQSYLSEALSGLIGYDMSDYIGVNFSQQEKKTHSIPDGLISQKQFTIYIETKNHDWFYNEQLENHLESLNSKNSGLMILIALSDFESTDESRFSKIKKICESKYKNKIIFSAVSFEDLISAIKIDGLPSHIRNTTKELSQYFDEMGYLPKWKNTLDVINCATLSSEVEQENIYLCPAKNGAYSHRRCKYFGMYRQKIVNKVAEIKAVYDVYDEKTAKLLWKNISEPENDLKNTALEKVYKLRPTEYPVRAFILDDLYETKFLKTSNGGMQGSKQYFDIGHLKCENSKELAESLNGLTWDDINLANPC